MSCLFRCIWLRGDGDGRRKHLVAGSLPSPSKESLATRQIGPIFLDCEMDSMPEQEMSRTPKNNNLGEDSLFRELKREADFLKACGAILETPAEIRKASGVLKDRDPGEDGRSSCKAKLWDEKEELSRFPVHERSCAFEVHQSPQDCECSLPSICLSKSVSSESPQNQLSYEPTGTDTPDVSPSNDEFQIHSFASERSPFPTPPRVTADMETPATSCQSSVEHDRTRNGKNTKIRIQYVYAVRNPLESPSQCKVLNEDSLGPVRLYDNFSQQTDHNPDASEEAEGWELSCTSGITSLSIKEGQQDEGVYTGKSVSEWALRCLERCSPRDMALLSPKNSEQTVTRLPQSEAPVENDGLSDEINSNEKSHSAKSTVIERPILGMDAENWKDEETKSRTWKRWDGNGIPNSTNKYKEDQKVSWHATPFVERLEKALSNDKLPTTEASADTERQWSWRKITFCTQQS